MNNVKAIVFEKDQNVRIGEFSLPELQDDLILVKTLYTFVSSGTELRVLQGHYGAEDNFPLVPGYAGIGKVLKVGKKASGYEEGDIVSYCPDGRESCRLIGIEPQWGGQAGYHLLPVDAAPIILPPGCDPLDYVIGEVAAISLRGAVAACPQPGESAVVIGQGMIGAFSAAWLHSRGCRVITVDVNDFRLNRSLKYGAFSAVNAREENAVERIRALCDGGADIVVESSGTTPGAALANQLIRKTPTVFRGAMAEVAGRWPRLVLQANYLEALQVDPWQDLDTEGVTVITPMDRSKEDRMQTIDAIRRGKIDSRIFIDRVVPVADAPGAYSDLLLKPDEVFSLVFDWDS